MKLATLCSGIGAPEVAAKRLGWECLWSAEIDPQASAVLAHHHSESVNLGDATKIKGGSVERPDVLVFGSPCQSFSVAGKRAGLDDPRGNITLECLRIVGELLPEWIVWENVPGVLSIDGGRTFGAILGIVGKLGYGFAYRILDAQFFGVPQRRRRVFLVGCLGGWQRAAAVLFERESLCGNSPPSREKGERVAPTVAVGPPFSRTGNERIECEAMVYGISVRRLTPRECERLQGFEDDYTAIPYKGKPMADGPRYKMIGNSMAVPVVEWMLNRIAIMNCER